MQGGGEGGYPGGRGVERYDGFHWRCFAPDEKDVQEERLSCRQLEIHMKHCKERPQLRTPV